MAPAGERGRLSMVSGLMCRAQPERFIKFKWALKIRESRFENREKTGIREPGIEVRDPSFVDRGNPKLDIRNRRQETGDL